MQWVTARDVRTAAANYLMAYDRAGILNEEEFDSVVEDAVDIWCDTHSLGYVTEDDVDDLYEIVEQVVNEAVLDSDA